MAHAQVSGAVFRFAANVDDQYDGYINTGVNESFDIQGGFETIPFDRAAMGGSPDDFTAPRQYARVTGIAQNLDGGGVYARISTDMSPGYVFDFQDDLDAFASMTFMVESEMQFELTLNSFSFSNDLGAGSTGLREVGGHSVFVASGYLDSAYVPTLVASGTLQPGEYMLFSESYSSAGGDISLSIFVPAPGSLPSVLGLSLVAARRARHRRSCLAIQSTACGGSNDRGRRASYADKRNRGEGAGGVRHDACEN
ncbi:MAG: hypothetical protein AAGI53_11870 [Planctomycetota bacterium]